MKNLILPVAIAVTAFITVATTERLIDYSLAQLVSSNDKLDAINVHRKKVGDFVTRWGYFFGYVVDEVEWMNHEFSEKHGHDEEHSPTRIIEAKVVSHFEKLNGYLDFVLDTSVMDRIVV